MSATVANLAALQSNQKRIRNICILAHVDHGKTTLSDSLLASNGIISSKLAGKVRYLDSREDEQERGITMKSSGISLYFKVIRKVDDAVNASEDFLINLIDSPGHVDFSSEVSTASRLCDGGLVLVDVVEGVCTQTHTVLRQALVESVRPVLVFNKIDRLITELQMSPTEAYVHMNQILEQVNAIVGTFHTEGVLEDDARNYDARMAELQTRRHEGVDDGPGDGVGVDVVGEDWALEERDDSDLYFAPEKGNVVFCSAVDGWAFRPEQFANIYASKLGVKEEVLKRFLWGDFYLDPKTKRVIGPKGLKGRNLKPFFVQFILDNVWAVYDAVFNDREKVEKIVKALNLKVLPRDLKSKDAKALLQTLMSQWLPLSSAILLTVVDQLPSPITAQQIHIPKILNPSASASVVPPPPGSEQERLETAMINCDPTSEFVVAYISKVFSVPTNQLPQSSVKRGARTAEEMRERRQQAIERAKARSAVAASSSVGGEDGAGELATLGPQGMTIAEAAIAVAEEEKARAAIAAAAAAEEDVGGETLIGFARIYSGTIRVGQRIHVLGPKYDPLKPEAHRTEIVVRRLFLLMGRELQDLESVPAGNMFGIAGIDVEGLAVKTATLSSVTACPSLGGLKGYAAPILRVALEPENPGEMNQLVEGLKLLNQADPCVEVYLQETGEHVIVTAGELHLERCIRDLRERFAKIDIQVSPPIVPFRETLSGSPAIARPSANASDSTAQVDGAALGYNDTSETDSGSPATGAVISSSADDSNLPLGTVVLSTPNKLATVRLRAVPLPKNLTQFLEGSASKLKRMHDLAEARHKTQGVSISGSTGIDDGRGVEEELEREKFLHEVDDLIAQAAKEGALVEKEVWHGVVTRIWALGPKEVGSNLLINSVMGYTRNSWSRSVAVKAKSKRRLEVISQLDRDDASDAGSRDESDGLSTASATNKLLDVPTESSNPADVLVRRSKTIRDFESSIQAGFQMATFAGPLCAEPMTGVAFFVESLKLDLDGAENNQIGLLSGQIITTVRDACRQAFLKWSPRLCLAMYSCDLQAPSEVLGKVYAVLAKRKGRILAEEMKEGTPFFNIKALLPVVESFGFSDDLRKRTAGAASPQLIFHGFDLLDQDPFWVPNTKEELEDLGEKADRDNIAKKYMDGVRKRKGLFVGDKIVAHAEKQRTLKQNRVQLQRTCSTTRMSHLPMMTPRHDPSRPSIGPLRSVQKPPMMGNAVSGVGGMAGLSESIQAMSRMSIADINSRVSIRGGGVGSAIAPHRRSSSYVGRPSSIGLAAMNTVMIKEPRPIREKSWQANAIRSLINFLVQAGYQQLVSAKTLQAPTGKDFQNIFKFLYAQLDPKYSYQKKFEEEVPIILRGLRYPFCDQITKSHLNSVGAMHAWPSLLAMLTWIVELILIENHNDMDEIGSPGELNGEKVFFEYLTKAYGVFLAGDDNYDAMDRELISNFDRKNEKVVREVEKLNAEHEVLSKEWLSLRDSESPLVIAERESGTLQSDIEKFKQYIHHLESKKQKLQDQVNACEEDLSQKDAELSKMAIEKGELQQIVDKQEISPADVDRMNAEREQLSRNLEALALKTEEINRLVWDKEINVQKKLDQLEKHLQEYSSLTYRLGVQSPDSSDAEGVNFEIVINVQAATVEKMVSQDLKATMKPVLMRIRSRYNSQLHGAQDEVIALQESVDRLNEALTEKTELLKEAEWRIGKVSQSYNEEKEVLDSQTSATSKELEDIETEMQRRKMESASLLALSQQKVQKASIELDQYNQKYEDARKKNLDEFYKALEEMLVFREHIWDVLNEVKQDALADLLPSR